MTSLFALIFLGAMNTAEARPHHHPPPRHHVVHTRPHHHPKPKHVRAYRHNGHRYYRHAGIVWRWVPGHWFRATWVKGHWEISYRI